MSSMSLNPLITEHFNNEIISLESQETTISRFNIAQIARIGLAALAILALLEVAVRAGLWGASIALSPAGLIIIPIILAAGVIGVASYYAITRLSFGKKNYEHTETLLKVKESAPHISFYNLYKEHGLKNLTTYIFNEPENENLSPSALKEKFITEASLLDLETITLRYDLHLLKDHKIVSDQFVFFAIRLQNRIIEARKVCAEDLKLLHDKCHARSQSFTNDLKNTETLVNGFSLGRRVNHISTAIDYLTSNASLIPAIQEISYRDALKTILDRNKIIYQEAQTEFKEHWREFL
jgi:hypothetical protein